MSKFVNVTITRNTQPTSEQGFGMPLILSGDKAAAYKEYVGASALPAISTDFGAASKTYKLAAAVLSQNPRVEKVAILGVAFTEGTTAATALTTALSTLVLANNDWFYLLSTLQADASITALSQWTTGQDKLYLASTSSKTLATALAAQVGTGVLVHPAPETYPAEALVGAVATLAPGSFTWTFKTLAGINPSGYTGTEISAIEAANGFTYAKEGGVNITTNSKATNGEYLDVVQSTYFLKARIAENVFRMLVENPKVGMTSAGIGMTVAQVEAALQTGFNNGIIAADADGVPMYSINYPTVAEISKNDRANRKLPNVTWKATIAGAIENVDIAGSLEI